MALSFSDGFFDRYNADLERLDCGARVTASPSCSADRFLLVDLDGKPIGELPSNIPSDAIAAVMTLVERSFEDGVLTGRAMERAEL